MANARFKARGQTIEVFGPRAEQVAHLLELDGNGAAKKLADRIVSHVADGEPGEEVLELDREQAREMREALDRLAAAVKEMPADLSDLREALR